MNRICNQCKQELSKCGLKCSSHRTYLTQLLVVGAITAFVALDQGIILEDDKVVSKSVPTSTMVSSRR